jgi:hypothetical protein
MRNIVKTFERLFIPNRKNDYKPHILWPRNLFYLAVILLIVKFIIFSWLYYFPQTSHFAIITSSKLVELANKERIAQGLSPLVINQQLVEAAEKKAIDMLNKDYFAHTSPNGLTPWYWLDKVGYKYAAAGENLAKDFTDSEYVNDAWMDSPLHRANILNGNYQDIGIAVVEGDINGQKTTVAVQFFGKGSVKVVKPVAIAENKADNKIEIPQPEPSKNVIGEEINLLKGPQVFKERGIISGITEQSQGLIGVITEKSEPVVQKIYIIVLGIISLVLMLSIFINIKVQYPKMILMTVIFLVLIAAIALFNGGAILNKGINII